MKHITQIWVERRYDEGWEIVVDGEPLSKTDGVAYFLKESEKINFRYIVEVEWQRNFNRSERQYV